MKRSRRFISAAAIVIIVLPIIAYVSITQWASTQIKYEARNGYAGYHSILEVKSDGGYTLEITNERGSAPKRYEGTIAKAEMTGMKRKLLANFYMLLPSDLSDHWGEDLSDEELYVNVAGVSKHLKGYGIRNSRFRDIALELEQWIEEIQADNGDDSGDGWSANLYEKI